MARSSRRLGAKTPGVSMKISCASPAVAMPRSSARVVCTLWETIATLVPTSALMSVDFPTLGAPISAMKPHRLPSSLGSAIAAIRLDAFAGEHGGSGGLFGGALGTAEPLRRSTVGQFHRHPEDRIVVGTLPFHFAIVRGRQSARLRPFLQNGLGVAQRPRRRSHPRFPEPLDQFGSRRISAVDEYGPDQCLADIGQDRGAAATTGIALRSSKPDRAAEINRARHIRARFLAHEVSEAPRHLALVSLRKRAKQHVGYDEPEHMVSKELQALIAAGTIARAGQRGDVGQRLLEQRRILEAVADAIFEGAGAATAPLGFLRLRRCRPSNRSGRRITQDNGL